MARLTVEDCLAHESNRFALVLLAATRAKQLAHGARPHVDCHNRVAIVALREIAAGRVRFNETVRDVVAVFIAEKKAHASESSSRTNASRRAARGQGPS